MPDVEPEQEEAHVGLVRRRLVLGAHAVGQEVQDGQRRRALQLPGWRV